MALDLCDECLDDPLAAALDDGPPDDVGKQQQNEPKSGRHRCGERQHRVCRRPSEERPGLVGLEATNEVIDREDAKPSKSGKGCGIAR